MYPFPATSYSALLVRSQLADEKNTFNSIAKFSRFSYAQMELGLLNKANVAYRSS